MGKKDKDKKIGPVKGAAVGAAAGTVFGLIIDGITKLMGK